MDARSAQEIWEAALGELEIQVSKPNYRTWLQKSIGLSYKDNQFVIGVPSTFVAEYLDKNQRSLIEKTLIGLTVQDIRVHFHVNGKHRDSSGSYCAIIEEAYPPVRRASPRFNLKYTFESFIAGSSNRLARAAAQQVAENPGHSYNPLFIYGGAGLGKTHLLQAIGHAALAKNIHVLYVSAEQFTNELVKAIRDRKTEEFRNKFRSLEMLLVDDIQFIGGKKQTEESFYHTFDELLNANHQIVLSSNYPPKAMPLLKERLRSRFEWGLIADIQPPDFETRLAILQAKAAEKGVDITLDILEFIALRVQQNIRELEGSLNRIIAFSQLIKAPLTTELAARALEDMAGKEPSRVPIASSLIIEIVANSFQLTPSEIKSRRRDKETTLARHVAMYIIRQQANCSLTQIGKELGNRDTATVIHACEKVSRDIEASPSLRRKILGLQQICLKQKGEN